ncbi:MAG: VCBS repeat-containing protein [Bacteroidaceae bacterium]|nr:VCBS repeat-containing protein [Bacteroidaceae bacterium]
MKKINIALLLFICILQSQAQIRVTTNLTAEDYTIENDNGYSRIDCGYQFYTDSIGYPEIPVIYKSYAIPIDATDISLQINECQTKVLLENCTLYPVQPPQINGSVFDAEFIKPDSIIYNMCSSLPNIEARIVSDKKMMGFRIVEIALYPFVYAPSNKVLYKRNLSCTLNYSSLNKQLFYAPKISEQRAYSARSFVAGIVENQDEVLNTSVSTVSKVRTADPNFSVQKNVIPDYIIITNEALKSEFQKLADWKTKKGVPTIIKTIEEIKNEYIGADLVEKIRNYLIEFGNNWGDEGLYLLLGGDIDIIPARMAKTVNDEDTKSYPTDACYVDPYFSIEWETEEWNSSDIRNICVGRLPVSTSQEARKYINKLIHYEKNNLEIDYSYVKNLLAAIAFIGDNYTFGAMNDVDEYRITHLPTDWKYWYLFDHFNCSCNSTVHKKKYDVTYGEELSKNGFISALNGGVPHGYPHLIYHDDHGHTFQLGTSTKIKGEGINQTDIQGLEDSPYQNIVFSGSCNTANFSQDCIGWGLLKKGNTVAYIGNSDAGWSNEDYLFESALTQLFTEETKNNIGYIHLKLIKHKSYGQRHRLHLLGDPEMPVWTDVPKVLEVSVSPESTVAHHNETTEIEIQISNLPEGEAATVCIMKDTEIYTVARIEDTNTHCFCFKPLTGGDIDVTVTAKNFKPFETAIPVQAVEPTLTIDSIAFLSGNNGIVSPGERVSLNISIKNDGLFTSEPVYTGLYTESPYITINKSTCNYGSIESGETLTTLENFVFTVAPDAPDISRKDFNAVTFYLTMSKEDGFYDVDTFRVDLISPKYKIVSHTKSPNTTVSAGDTYTFTTEFQKIGNVTASDLHIELDELTEGFDFCTKLSDTQYSIKIADSYQNENELNLKIKLCGNGVVLDSCIVDFKSVGIIASNTIVKFKSNEKAITLYWTGLYGAYGYHIYRSNTIDGVYTRLNKLPLTGGYYIDEDLNMAQEFYYKISAVNSSLLEGPLSSPIKAWTVYPTSGLYPIALATDNHCYVGEATTVDFDYDGQQEIILMAKHYERTAGTIVIARPDGTEPFDIDMNVTSFSGYDEIPWNAEATPTVADIYGTGEPCIIALTRNDTYTDNHVICYSSKDEDGNHKPDSLWDRQLTSAFYRSAVVTDIDYANGKGEKEIILRSEGGTQQIPIYDCRGNLIRTIGEGNLNSSYGNLAVADLDEDGYKEIISPSGSQLYVWNYDGTLKNGSVFFTESNNRNITSTPIVCDFDADGEKDIIVASKTDPGYIYVIKQDGSCLSGFDGNSNSASIPYATSTNHGICHSISVGDINNDGKLEIVSLGTNYIRAWNRDGTLCLNRYFGGLFPNVIWSNNLTTPILADIDGDNNVDIVFHMDDKIYAINNHGEDIVGFPLYTTYFIDNGICIADTDNDGLNEIIVGDKIGLIYMWETKGKSSAIEWGRTHFDTENTSEYVNGYKDQWVITSSTTWSGGTFSNDIIVRSGTFTIPEGVILNMRKPYRIYVMDGGTLNINGGTITNADIVIKDGGTLNVTQNSTINLRSAGGNLQVDKGGTMNMPQGAIY